MGVPVLSMASNLNGHLEKLARNDEDADTYAKEWLREFGGDGIPFGRYKNRPFTTIALLCKEFGLDKGKIHPIVKGVKPYLKTIGMHLIPEDDEAGIDGFIESLGENGNKVLKSVWNREQGLYIFPHNVAVFILMLSKSQIGDQLRSKLGVSIDSNAEDIFASARVLPTALPIKEKRVVAKKEIVATKDDRGKTKLSLVKPKSSEKEKSPKVSKSGNTYSFAIEILETEMNELFADQEELLKQAEEIESKIGELKETIKKLRGN